MNFTVEPVSITAVNGTVLKKAGSTVVLEDLHRRNIDLKDPAALALFVEGNLSFINAGFIILSEDDRLLYKISQSFIIAEIKSKISYDWLIGSANINVWRSAIVTNCTGGEDRVVRLVYNEIAKCIEMTRLKEFVKLNKKQLNDNSLLIT